MFDEHKLMTEGKPFMIQWTIPDGTTEQTFDLDTETYDGLAAFFASKMLWISAIKVIAGDPTNDFAFLDLDDVLFWESPAAGDDLELSGDLSAGVGRYPTILDKYAVPFVPVRSKIACRKTASGAVDIITIWGLYTDRTG